MAADDLIPDYESPSLPSQGRVVRKGKFITDEALAERDARMVAAGRRQAAEEIAVAIEAAKPSVKRFWDTADAARVYALNDAAKIARRLGAPAEPVEEGNE